MIPYMPCLDLWLKRKEGKSIEGSEWLIKIKLKLSSPNLIHDKGHNWGVITFPIIYTKVHLNLRRCSVIDWVI